MNILITGCNGQLGNEIQLLEPQYPGHTFFNTDVAELDITDPQAINDYVTQNSIDVIVNCAAYTAVDKAEDNPQLCSKLNAQAPAFLAKAIVGRGGLMVQISTDYVFDGTAHKPYTEDQPTSPNSVYGRTKLEGEQAVQQLCQQYIIIRTAWLYSTFGNNFVKTMIRLGQERAELGVIADQIGSPTYARDLAKAVLMAVDKHIATGIYHFTNEGVASWYDFTLAIHQLAGIDSCHVRPLHTYEYPTPASRPHYSVLDKAKIRQALGIEIPHWREALTQCLYEL